MPPHSDDGPKPRERRGPAEPSAEPAASLSRYVRAKVDQLLVMMGSKPLLPGELDDKTLLELDPIGEISDAFAQVLTHLKRVNQQLRTEIAERRRTEEALRESEERFRTLAEFASDWVFWRGPDGKMVYVAPASEYLTGYTPADFRASPDLINRIIHPDDRDRWLSHCHMADAEGLPDPMEFRIITRSGEIRWIVHVCRPVYSDAGEFLGVRGSNSNITERKLAEDALRESEESLRDFIDNALDLIQSVGPDGRFLHVNRAWRETLGYAEEEVARLTIADIVPPEGQQHCFEMLRRVLAGENVGGIETIFVARDGRRIEVEGYANCRFEDGRPVATRGIFRNVTEKKRLEEELLKGRKLESIGVLAGGIAHDFNNLLTGILGNVSLCRMSLDPLSDPARRLAEAEAASLRAKDLTRQLLTFSKGGSPIRRTSAIGDLVRAAAQRALRGSAVRAEYAIAEDLLPVDVDEGQIGEVIRNLVVNAVQATSQGGTITIRAANVKFGSSREAPRVLIVIEDTGIGIPRENLFRIFDPFFTTKEKGRGLGLAAAYSIVQSHEGTITVESEPGRGTSFSVWLPASSGTVQERKEDAKVAGKGRILVMDDEEAVRDVAVNMLRFIGYQGVAVKDGEEAMTAYREALSGGAPFDAVIMDLAIPGGMGGKEALLKLREIDPRVKGIVSSGYSNDPVMSDFRKHGFIGVIAKPYTLKDLADVLGSSSACPL